MKKLAILLTGAFLTVSTLGMTFNVVSESDFFDGKKTKVERNELPQEVIGSLEESQYQDWEIQEAYRVEDDQTNEVHYELHLASAMDAHKVKNVTFNESGEIISEKDSDLGRTGEQELEQEGTEPGMESESPEQQY